MIRLLSFARSCGKVAKAIAPSGARGGGAAVTTKQRLWSYTPVFPLIWSLKASATCVPVVRLLNSGRVILGLLPVEKDESQA